MRLLIDATNIVAGGGLTHLVELLRNADPLQSGFDIVFILASERTLSRIDDRSWLVKLNYPALDRTVLLRTLWLRANLKGICRDLSIDLLFAPGGTLNARVRTSVVMSQNMLPFEWRELRRFGLSLMTLKLVLLRLLQASSFRKANGVIFLTEYARKGISKAVGGLGGENTIIPHGISSRFFSIAPEIRDREQFSQEFPLRVIYVSMVDAYKHQEKVTMAAQMVSDRGLPITVDFYGGARRKYLAALNKLLGEQYPVICRYRGCVDYEEMEIAYRKGDLIVFASSCENLPNILIEGMATGIPIACSNMGPMPEILLDGGYYFDPLKPNEIADAILDMADDLTARRLMSSRAKKYAMSYSWIECADSTFSFLSEVARRAGDSGIVRDGNPKHV